MQHQYRKAPDIENINHTENYKCAIDLISQGNIKDAIYHIQIATEACPTETIYWEIYIEILIKAEKLDLAYKVAQNAYKHGLDSNTLEVINKKINEASCHEIDKNHYLMRGIECKEKGHYVKARDLLVSWIQTNSKDAFAYAHLAHTLLLIGADEHAEAAINIAKEIDSSLNIIKINQARILLKKQKPAKALQMAWAACNSNAEHIENHLVLASTLIANEKLIEASQLLESIIQKDSNYAEAYATRSMLKMRQNKIDDAIKDAIKALSIKPHLDQLWGAIGYMAAQLSKNEMAMAALKNAITFDPYNSKYLTALGELNRRVGSFEKAIEYFQKVLKQDPRNCNAWISLGASFQQINEKNKAINSYTRALSIDSNLPEVYNNLAAIASNDKDFEKAIGYYKQAIAIKPNFASAHNNFGVALRNIGRFSEAESCFRHAIAIDGALAEAHSNLGNILRDLGRTKEAEASHRESVRLQPLSSEALSNLGVTLTDLGQLTMAHDCYLEAIKINPEYAEAYNNLGNLLRDRGDNKEAEINYLKAVSLQKDFAGAFNNLGELYYRCGDLQKAETCYIDAISSQRDNAEAYRNLIFLLMESGRVEDALMHLNVGLAEISINKIPVISAGSVLLWIEGLIEEAKRLTKDLPPYTHETDRGNLKLDLIYIRYVSKLLEHAKVSTVVSSQGRNNINLIAMGESHCLPLKNLDFKWLGLMEGAAVCRFVRGIKMHHLKLNEQNIYTRVMRQYFERVDPGAHLLFTIGEIDCRPNEGIWSVHKKLGEQIEDLINKTVNEYLLWLKVNLGDFQFSSITIQGIPAPNYPLIFQNIEDRSNFLNMIRSVNSQLKWGTLSNGWKFLDIYEASVNEIGISNKKWHLDEYHISPDFYDFSPDWVSSNN